MILIPDPIVSKIVQNSQYNIILVVYHLKLIYFEIDRANYYKKLYTR